MSRIRALIVNDEPLARGRLVAFLARAPDVDIVGQCATADAALAAIAARRPDVVFLDVQVPGLPGLAAAEALRAPRAPAIVLVTARDMPVLRAFGARAMEFLLEPFDDVQLERVLEHVRARLAVADALAAPELQQRLARVLDDLDARRHFLDRMLLRMDGSLVAVQLADVDWLEAADNYVRLHLGRDEHRVRGKLRDLERRLDPAQFIRVHRSAIVNVDRIRELQPWLRGDGMLILRDGARVPVGRTYRERLLARFMV